MLYGYDPILPFQYADKLKHGILSGDDADCECDVDMSSEVSGLNSGDLVTSRIKEMKKIVKIYLLKLAYPSRKHRNIKQNVTTTDKTRVNHLRLVIYA